MKKQSQTQKLSLATTTVRRLSDSLTEQQLQAAIGGRMPDSGGAKSSPTTIC